MFLVEWTASGRSEPVEGASTVSLRLVEMGVGKASSSSVVVGSISFISYAVSGVEALSFPKSFAPLVSIFIPFPFFIVLFYFN